MIETCVYINIALRDTLNLAAREIGVSRNKLVHLLFSRVMKEKRLTSPKIFTRVKYQDADPKKEWKSIGIDLQPDMFEKCQDLRKVLKMSVSLILAYGIRAYLDDVIAGYLAESESERSTRNNYEPYYSIQRMFNAGIEGFLITWTKNQPPQPATP